MQDYLSFEDTCGLIENRSVLKGADEALSAFQRKILEGQSYEEVLDYVFATLGIFVPFERLGIAIQEGEWLRSKWVRSRIPVEHLRTGYSAKIAGSSLEKVLKEGRARVIADLEHYLRDHPNSASTELIVKDGMRSSLTFPLQLRDNSFGVVFFSSVNAHAYTMEHVRLLESVAQGLALVIEHAELRESKQEIKNQKIMLSKVLHDLRSPLSVMISFSDLLANSPEFPGLDESSKKMLSVIRRNEDVLWSLVNELSDLAALRSNQMSVRCSRVPTRTFMLETLEGLRPICARKRIDLSYDIQDGLPEYWLFDPLRIRQVLENLVSNAAKFSNPGDHVNLGIWSDGYRLTFAVSDEGAGIPEEDLPKLFKEFGIANVRPTAGEKCTGLGLAICQQIVKNHDGEITVNSRVGKGSCFEFWLPSRQLS